MDKVLNFSCLAGKMASRGGMWPKVEDAPYVRANHRHRSEEPFGQPQDAQNGLAQSLRLRREDLDDRIHGVFSRRSLNDSAESALVLFVAKSSIIVRPNRMPPSRD